MKTVDTRKDRPAAGRSRKRKSPAIKKAPGAISPAVTPVAAIPARPACLLTGGQGSCPEWEDLLFRYPMIDSVQREDFPEHGASFVYLAHLFRGLNTAEEGLRAQKEYEAFFRAIGYEYHCSGNFESRWFEGVGVRIGDTARTGR
jgi:hypothetical protein